MTDASASRIDPWPSAPVIVLLFGAAWLAFQLAQSYPGFVHEDPAEIAMWSSLGFDWGYVKHPPLLPWIVGAFGLVVPISQLSLAFLAAVNLTLAFALVCRLGARVVGPDRVPVVAVLFCLSPYTTLQAIKLNHNSILLSLWPLATLAFLSMLRAPTVASGVWLGVAAALAVYAKYSSGLLLIAFGVAALASARRRSVFSGPGPYVAVGVFAALMAPHVAWAVADRMSTLAYAAQSLVPLGKIPWSMITANLLGAAPVFAGAVGLAAWLGRSHGQASFAREIAVIAAVPYVLTIGLCMALGLRASHTWALPTFAYLPVILAAFINQPSAPSLRTIWRWALAAALLLPIGGAIGLALTFQRGGLSATDPQAEFARDTAAIWAAGTGAPLRIVGGDHHYAMAANVALADRPAAWAFGEQAPWITPERVKREGMVVLCRDGAAWLGCRTAATDLINAGAGWHCRLTRRRTLWGLRGPAVSVDAYFIAPAGFVADGRSGFGQCRTE